MAKKRGVEVSIDDLARIGKQLCEFFTLNSISRDYGVLAMEFLIADIYSKAAIKEEMFMEDRRRIYQETMKYRDEYERLMNGE